MISGLVLIIVIHEVRAEVCTGNVFFYMSLSLLKYTFGFWSRN